MKIKALEKPANEAYISTLIELAFRNNDEIRCGYRPEKYFAFSGFLLIMLNYVHANVTSII